MIARFGLVLLLSLFAGSALAGAGGHSSSAAAASGSAKTGAGRVSKAPVAGPRGTRQKCWWAMGRIANAAWPPGAKIMATYATNPASAGQVVTATAGVIDSIVLTTLPPATPPAVAT